MNIFGIIALYFLSIICVSIIIGEITLRIERKNNKVKRKSIFETNKAEFEKMKNEEYNKILR